MIRRHAGGDREETLVIQCGSESRAIPLDNIYYMESRNRKVVLYLKEGELEYYAKIGDLEEELHIINKLQRISRPDWQIGEQGRL